MRLGRRNALFVLLAGVAFLCWLAVPKSSIPHNPVEGARPAQTIKTSATRKSDIKPRSAALVPSEAAAGAATSKPIKPQPAGPATAACKLLSPGVAQQALGTSATFVTSSTANDAKTTDMETTNCSYAGKDETIILVAHVALTALGNSENGVAFGSDKPSGATDVQGLGQAAYWDPSTAQLNVLSDNNWYVIQRARGTPPSPANLTDVEAVARHITFGG